MLLNSDQDGYAKTPIHRKIFGKMHKSNPLETKRILKLKYKLSGDQFLHLPCQGRRFAPLTPSVTPLADWPPQPWSIQQLSAALEPGAAVFTPASLTLCGVVIRHIYR